MSGWYQIEEDTDRDYFMNAWEAKEYGIVDGVIDDGKPGLVAPIGEIKEPPKSRIWDYWTIKEGKERKLLPSEERPAPKEASEEREPTAV
jgi:ATP-dependent Clp protease protease subunit